MTYWEVLKISYSDQKQKFTILKSCPEKFSKNYWKTSAPEPLFNMWNSLENIIIIYLLLLYYNKLDLVFYISHKSMDYLHHLDIIKIKYTC